jgi:hypothetical protein
VYNLGLDEFIAWFTEAPRPAGFTKATVTAWRVALKARKLGPISITVRITAVRKLARDSRWCIVDLVGKHGRVRTIPMPTWTKNAIDAWTVVAGVIDGHLFRPVNRGDQVCGERMGEKVIWQMLKTYVAGAGLPDIALDPYVSELFRSSNPQPLLEIKISDHHPIYADIPICIRD